MTRRSPAKRTGPRRRLLLAAGVLSLSPFQAVAQEPWELITPEEAARDSAAPQVPIPPDLPPPPTIELVRPDISQPIRNPVTIELRFTPGPSQSIDMRTFHAAYGRLGINITRRLLDHAVATSNSLSAANVELPTGNHRVTMSIADMSGKRASRTFQFSVAS
jgi:hypothetical protein